MFEDFREPVDSESEGEERPDWVDELADDTATSDDTLASSPAFPSFDDESRFSGELFGESLPEAQAARGDGLILGMTAQQRAVLAVFLFLDVSVLGCVLLLAAEAISIP